MSKKSIVTVLGALTTLAGLTTFTPAASATSSVAIGFMNPSSLETSKIETPLLPPAAGTPLELPLSLPVKQFASNMDADACASLTTANIQAVIDKIIKSISKAQLDKSANGVNGAYASAPGANLDSLAIARDKMLGLKDWLHTAGVLDPPPFVTNTTGAYNVNGYVSETVSSLHSARHWAMISVVYHNSADAQQSYELTTQALDLIEPLGAQAGRCYMSPVR